MTKIFKILGKEPNETLTVEEFIETYVYYEEQLKIKIIKINLKFNQFHNYIFIKIIKTN